MKRGTPPLRQRGAALLMAMIIVALVATLSVSMVWQQWRAVQVEASERARAQSAWVLSGALDFALLILSEDARRGGPDDLSEPWAVPLAEARLSTFLAVDKNNTDDGPEAFLSGDITDAMARYNLYNLVANNAPAPAEVQAFQRLCTNVGVAPEVAVQIANQLVRALATTTPQIAVPTPGQPTPVAKPAPDGPLMPETPEQLVWLGVPPDAIKRLEPFVTMLPPAAVRTTVNLNTAPREVLAAVIEKLDLGGAERLVQARQRAPFRKFEDAQAQVPGITLNASVVDIKSRYFNVRGRIRVGNQVLEQRSLVERRGTNRRDMIPLTREWITTRDNVQVSP